VAHTASLDQALDDLRGDIRLELRIFLDDLHGHATELAAVVRRPA
jgi:hypothetical protein